MIKTKSTLNVAFPTNPTSPFADKFDLDEARAMVAHLLNADPANIAQDPAYSLFVEYETRVKMIDEMRATHRIRFEANREVPTREATKMSQIGDLDSEADDTMLLHTRHAMRLLIGRVNAPGQKGMGIAGGWKAAAAIKEIWHLSAKDNPYADWALVQLMELHKQVINALEQECDNATKALETMKTKGIDYSVLRSKEPVKVSIEFRSPYGYAIAELVAQFDYYVRMVKTLHNRNRLSDREENDQLKSMRQRLRHLFERAVHLERLLRNENLRQLSRRDWLPIADETAKEHIAGAIALMGEIPREVFDGTAQPRYSKRRAKLTERDLRLLKALPLDPAAAILKSGHGKDMDPTIQARLV